LITIGCNNPTVEMLSASDLISPKSFLVLFFIIRESRDIFSERCCLNITWSTDSALLLAAFYEQAENHT
jgi:hypothetical protein